MDTGTWLPTWRAFISVEERDDGSVEVDVLAAIEIFPKEPLESDRPSTIESAQVIAGLRSNSRIRAALDQELVDLTAALNERSRLEFFREILKGDANILIDRVEHSFPSLRQYVSALRMFPPYQAMLGRQIDQLALLHFRSLLDIALVLWCEGELRYYRHWWKVTKAFNIHSQIEFHTGRIERTERVLSDCLKKLRTRKASVSNA